MLFSCERAILEVMATLSRHLSYFQPAHVPLCASASLTAPPTSPWKSRGSLRAVENGETIGYFSRDANEYARNRDICEPIFLEREKGEEKFIKDTGLTFLV